MVLKSDIAKFWPFNVVGETAAPPRTGAAPEDLPRGHLVEAEFVARCARNDVKASLAEEAEVLVAWLRDEHPNFPRLTAKTIKNNLRAVFRQHKEARN